MVLFQQLTEAAQLPTPGRSDMHNREAVNRSPMSTATQCASKLQALLAGHRNAPSDDLRAVLREFPWILEVFNLKPYHFYKITEPLIRAEKGLWREVIKHLNQIEEQILECHAWKDDSPLWDVISRAQQNIPQCKEVFPQWRIETFQESLRNEDNVNGAPSMAHPSPGHSGSNQGHLDTNKTAFQRSSAGSCHGRTAAQASSAPSSPEASGDNRPPRCDSLALFFRKNSHLSVHWVLGRELQHKIWTCFEHSLVAHIDLMRDRHLDQLLMCALYVGAKVTEIQTSFEAILNCYREQSHKKSHVYRSVYLRRTAGHDERDDIIKFYNDIYVSQMSAFVKSFCSGARMNDIVCLTPLPRAKYMLNSPKRQISPNIKLFVSPLKVDHFVTPERHTYHFNQSPAKDLLRINETVRSACVDVARKRILLDSDTLEDKPATKKHVLYEKIEAFVRGRQDP
ncbi:hypothetical protein HPB52_002759 [Rhipicephalus sanguineus]|uniref:Retinoblastoma-associated protein A-box domain-containing protein n=1 Tax=Rhipicephalus sanguineus TaxID=34632 RepID=A0A9D4T539_RHISA|nr:hypothetical protein HPB52_002759 [Rhipicephalus sanguineus]